MKSDFTKGFAVAAGVIAALIVIAFVSGLVSTKK